MVSDCCTADFANELIDGIHVDLWATDWAASFCVANIDAVVAVGVWVGGVQEWVEVISYHFGAVDNVKKATPSLKLKCLET